MIQSFQERRGQRSLRKGTALHGQKVRHYGLTNHKEYFAESTEAYLGVNDFYPFVRAELQEHDPEMYELLKKSGVRYANSAWGYDIMVREVEAWRLSAPMAM